MDYCSHICSETDAETEIQTDIDRQIMTDRQTETDRQTKRGRDLNVSGRNLQSHSETVWVETVIKSYQSSMNSGLNQIVSKLFESDRLDPLNDALIRPHQHVYASHTQLTQQVISMSHSLSSLMTISRWIWVNWYQNVSILDLIGAKDD